MTTLAEFMLALSLPFAGLGDAHNACPTDYAPYRLNWTANIANERNVSGLPTLAFAMSPNGPALPVELKFGGPQDAFLFDSPRVEGVETGQLVLEQHLSAHDQYTTTELLFNRHVTNLRMTIEDLDENRSYSAPYRDTLVLGGWNKHFDGLVEPIVSQDGATEVQNKARRELRQRLGREDQFEITPKATGPFGTKHWSTIEAEFPEPVSYVKMTFGSDPDVFPPSLFSKTPGNQSLRITDVTFCVPFGSRVGD